MRDVDCNLFLNELLFDDEGDGVDVKDLTGGKLLEEGKIEIRETRHKGFGVFSKENFTAGQFLFRTVSPFGRIDVSYSNYSSMKKYMLRICDLIVCAKLDENGVPSKNPMDPHFDLYALINEPGNTQSVNVQYHPIYNSNSEIVSIGVWAVTNIEPGEEICCHYGMFDTTWTTPVVPLMTETPEFVRFEATKPIIHDDIDTFVAQDQTSNKRKKSG